LAPCFNLVLPSLEPPAHTFRALKSCWHAGEGLPYCPVTSRGSSGTANGRAGEKFQVRARYQVRANALLPPPVFHQPPPSCIAQRGLFPPDRKALYDEAAALGVFYQYPPPLIPFSTSTPLRYYTSIPATSPPPPPVFRRVNPRARYQVRANPLLPCLVGPDRPSGAGA